MDFYSLNESANRYSVEVNYRTTVTEVREGFAKLVLGYVSAAMKERNYYVKKYFAEHPFRIIVSAQNWVDGNWCLVVSYYPAEDCFVVSKGFYNKDRDTVTVQSTEKCAGHSAAEVFRSVYNTMHKIKDEKPHHVGDLKGVKGKTGPKQGSIRPTQSFDNMLKFLKPSGDDKVGM